MGAGSSRLVIGNFLLKDGFNVTLFEKRTGLGYIWPKQWRVQGAAIVRLPTSPEFLAHASFCHEGNCSILKNLDVDKDRSGFEFF
jgi:hypothetical protein